MNLKNFFDILKLNPEEREDLFDSAFPLRKTKDGNPKLASEELEEKVKDSVYEIAQMYFSVDDDYENILQILTIGKLKRAVYLDELRKAEGLKDSADRNSRKAQLFADMRNHICYEIGVQSEHEAENPNPEKTEEYVAIGQKYIESIK